MRHVDQFFRKSCYSNIRILLSACGIWPFQALSKRYAMYVGFTLLFGFGISFTILCTIRVWPDFFEVFDCASMLFYAISSTIKLIYTVYNLPKIKMLLMNMQEHWCSPKSDQEAKILRSYVLFARKFGYIYSGIILGHAIVFALTPLTIKFSYNKENISNKTQDSQESSRHINYMLDLQIQHMPLLIQGALCEFYYTLVLTSINVLYLVCVQHCCGLFEALKYHLESAFNFENNDNDITSIENKYHSNIVYGVRRHAEAIQFATSVESLYRLPFFLHMTVNVSLLSIVGFQVVTNTENISRLMPYGTYLSGLVLNTFFENWQGQKIIDCNERVYESAYNLEWYKMPIISQKLLIMIMIRSRKPLTITAGKVLVLSYVTFNAASHI
ncbi:PREDICTED: odorant receptor 67a-like isoform X2 [Vollenhovia emeryi]|uniref:odorant receptor 67a-like isoform X2 n=1 Tax=Vollenhovia emeryi TaxID=411798 RepID=UPI0005F40A66|nr:PREDICTED: odorant receptor 67a-like isoform X2 [Vollenhovia emeryi]